MQTMKSNDSETNGNWDAAGLATAARRLLEQPAERATLGEAARRTFERLYDRRTVSAGLVRAMEGL